MLIGAGAKILGNIEVGACARVAAGSEVSGGALMTPALIFLNVPPSAAVANDLVAASVNKSVGATVHWYLPRQVVRSGLVDVDTTYSVVSGFTVPAMNIRMATYYTARAAFRAAGKASAGAFIGVAVIVLRGDFAALAALEFNLGDLLFVASAIAWAVYLIPKALKHHDEVARTRSRSSRSRSRRRTRRR